MKRVIRLHMVQILTAGSLQYVEIGSTTSCGEMWKIAQRYDRLATSSGLAMNRLL
jgi:hypothetical protein